MKKLFAYLLVVVGVVTMLFAILMALGAWQSDREAGKQNRAEWEEYNAWVAQVDTMENTALADSLIEARPKPATRQGGFATVFGVVIGVVVLGIASLPLAGGLVMLSREKRKRLNQQ